MKNLLLTLAISGVALFARAQEIDESKVPVKIVSNFNSYNPNVTVLKWEMEKDNYRVYFNDRDVESAVLYNLAGHEIESEFTAGSGDLPDNAYEYIRNAEPKDAIKRISFILDASGKKSIKVEIHDMYYFFEYNGTLIKKMKK